MTASVNSISLFLYTTLINFFDSITEAQQKVATSKNLQKNAGFWIVVIVALIIVGIAFLMWVCLTYGGGAEYGGKFQYKGLTLKVYCK